MPFMLVWWLVGAKMVYLTTPLPEIIHNARPIESPFHKNVWGEMVVDCPGDCKNKWDK